MVTAVRSGHRTAHQPFLPKSNQPLKPLLFCFGLLDKQLRDKGEKKKSRHNSLTFSLFVIICWNMYRLFQWPKKKPSCRGLLKYKGDINTLVKAEPLIIGKPRHSDFSLLLKQQLCHIAQVLIFVSCVRYTERALVHLPQVIFNLLILKKTLSTPISNYKHSQRNLHKFSHNDLKSS